MATTPSDFYANHISGMQRLANSNTLICEGTAGHVFEVTSEGEVVWKYAIRGGVNLFRAEFYALDFVAFDGKDLTFQGEVAAKSGLGGNWGRLQGEGAVGAGQTASQQNGGGAAEQPSGNVFRGRPSGSGLQGGGTQLNGQTRPEGRSPRP